MPAGRGIGAGAARPAVTPTSDRIGPFEVVNLVKVRVGPHQQPRAVAGVAELPKTETGKIQRFRRRPP